MKERKKYGHKGARKSFQFSKRWFRMLPLGSLPIKTLINLLKHGDFIVVLFVYLSQSHQEWQDF
jgi:hypothetical protein